MRPLAHAIAAAAGQSLPAYLLDELTRVAGRPPVADRAWELRDNLTADDATFVALAEALEVPLVTCDARIARAPGHQASVELFPGG